MRLRLLAVASLLVPLSACGGGAEPDTLTVLAAASLTDVFEELADDFEARHDGVAVELVLGSSTDLAETAADGAPGDVLATADETSMQVAVDAGVVASDPAPFASNQLVIATAPDNPLGISDLADLAGTTWVRCADDVPCGRVATALLDEAGLDAEPASLEVDVRATLEKVATGEADAGLVYASDAVAAGDAVDAVPIAGSADFPAVYLLAPLDQAVDADLAAAWVELARSGAGAEALREAGFSAP